MQIREEDKPWLEAVAEAQGEESSDPEEDNSGLSDAQELSTVRH
jgi:hypothetical protein